MTTQVAFFKTVRSRHTHSVQAVHTTSLGSSIPMRHSTQRDTRNTAPCFSRKCPYGLHATDAMTSLPNRMTFVLSYGLSFASITALIVHSALYFVKPISIHFRRGLAEQPDIHAQLMSKYRQGTYVLRDSFCFSLILGITF